MRHIITYFFNKGLRNLKITSDNETLAENKVLILYLLDQVHKPITNDNLYKLVLSAIDMNYFYYQQFLLDLISADFILSYQIEDQTVYELTSHGKTTLDLTLDILPGIIKLKADTNLKPMLDDIENDNIIAEFIPKSEDHYTVNCKIMENNEKLLPVQEMKPKKSLTTGKIMPTKFTRNYYQY